MKQRTWLASLLIVGALAAGCGDASDSKGDKDADTSTNGAQTDGVDSEDGDGDSGEPPKFCDLLTAEQVSEAVGATVTLTTGPFDACEFEQEDPRAASGSLGSVEVDIGNGGYDGYKSGSAATLTNSVVHDVSGVGEQAYITTGTFGGGESLQAGGGVLIGGLVHTVNISQASGMTEEALVKIGEALLKLVADAV